MALAVVAGLVAVPASAQTAPPITVPDNADLNGGASNDGGAITADVTSLGKPGTSATPVPRPRPRIRRISTKPRPIPRFPVCMVPLGEGGDGPCATNPVPTTPAAPPPTPPTPAQLARGAGQRTELPVPGIRTSPPVGSDQLVNLSTWMWVENWQPQTATASEGGLSVTVTATPTKVVWRMGAGDPVTCKAGSAWDPALREEQQSSLCTFTYRRSSADQPDLKYRATATMTFDVTWTSTNGESGSLGQASTTTDFRMRVAEGQALVIG